MTETPAGCSPAGPAGEPDSTHESLPADPTLVAEGWVRRHLADPDRAREAIELYSSLGLEVKAQTLEPTDFGARCQGCASTICSSYVLIYTRRRA